MSGVRGVLDYAGCFSEAVGSVDRVNGWKAGLRDGLGFAHNPLQFLAVLVRTGAIPSCDTSRKNAYYGASVKVGERALIEAVKILGELNMANPDHYFQMH